MTLLERPLYREGQVDLFFIPAVPKSEPDLSLVAGLDLPESIESLARKLNSPEEIQRYLHTLRYNHLDTTRSARGIIETNTAHCFEGSSGLAYALLKLCGYHPRIVMIQADNELSVDHNLAVYSLDGRLGAVAMSSLRTLMGRPPRFKSLRSLIKSYESYYTADYPPERVGEPALIGYTDPIDLDRYGMEVFFAKGDQAMRHIYDTYTDGVMCTNFKTGESYPYPPGD